MDTGKYIASGVLELYVLDCLEPAERRRVEELRAVYPEIAEELERIEATIEEAALAAGIPPNPAVLERALESISTLDRSTAVKPSSSAKWIPWVIAALLGLLSLFLFRQYQRATADADVLNQEIRTLQSRLTTLERTCAKTDEQLLTARQQLDVLTSPDLRTIPIGQTAAVVFASAEVEEVLFNVGNLGAPPAGKQYELWVIDGSGPRNLGVVAPGGDTVLVSTPYVNGAVAYAISLEDAGTAKEAPDGDAILGVGPV